MTADQLFDAVVFGSGPAGATAALGLARLGFSVAVINRPRTPTVEGLSARALAGFREAGFEVTCASGPSPRLVNWAGQSSMRGQESLVRRDELDGHLLDVVRVNGPRQIDATVKSVRLENETWHVETSRGCLRGRSVLDARGRRARRSDARGPLLVARSSTYRSEEGAAPASAVAALEDGWCWFARDAGGRVSLQFVGAAACRLSRQDLADRYRAGAAALPEFGRIDHAAASDGGCLARAAVARYSRPSQGVGFLRIGDAAVAMDPLSGNGIHEAVRSARVGVAAINSYLGGTQWSVVSRFVDEGARELWRRSVSVAAAFYRLQAEQGSRPFWDRTASAYERAARAAKIEYEGPGRFEMRPVLDGQQIDIRRVWVSAEWPRGVWMVNGRPLDQAPAGQIPSILRGTAGVSRYEV